MPLLDEVLCRGALGEDDPWAVLAGAQRGGVPSGAGWLRAMHRLAATLRDLSHSDDFPLRVQHVDTSGGLRAAAQVRAAAAPGSAPAPAAPPRGSRRAGRPPPPPPSAAG